MWFEEMTCKELVELVTNYLEGTLPEAERARFEAHLATCNGCTHYLAQMRETIHLTGVLREDDVQPPAIAELLNVFRAWKKGSLPPDS